MAFKPYQFLSLVFFALLTFVFLRMHFDLPIFDFGATEGTAKSGGAVIAYALTVLKNAEKEYFQAIMMVLFIAAIIYCLVQIVAIERDISAVQSSNSKNRSKTISTAISLITSRPVNRFSEPGRFSKKQWQTYAQTGANQLISPIRLLTQIFPLLGFLGTIAGIASSLNYLPTGEDNSGDIALLTQSLYTAFDTTFIGLTASFVLLISSFYLVGAWSKFSNLADNHKK